MAYWVVLEWEGRRANSAHMGSQFPEGFKTFEEAEEWRNLPNTVIGKLPPQEYRIEPDEDEVAPQPQTEITMYGIRNKIYPNGATFTSSTLDGVKDFFLRHPDWVNLYLVDELVRVKTFTVALRIPPSTPYIILEEEKS